MMHIRCTEDEVPRLGVRVLHGPTGVSTHSCDRRKSYSVIEASNVALDSTDVGAITPLGRYR